MLKVFKVKGFKNFKEEIIIDFSKVNEEYDFNKEIIKENIINKAAIYGINGSGKSNLGLAVFDIIKNLTDLNSNNELYNNFLTADPNILQAEFTYIFQIGKSLVEYNYVKIDTETILSEELKVNNIVFIKYDRRKKEEPIFNFPEAQSLNKKIGSNKISVVKYAINNTLLAPNSILMRFMKFVNSMLFFKSVGGNKYIGYTVGVSEIGDYLVKNNLIEGLNTFFKELEVNYKIVPINSGERKTIGVLFESGKVLPFYEVASTGTIDLVLLYFWLCRFKEMSFIYIDEFDAHYHFKLSKNIVEKLIKMEGPQIIVTTHTTSLMTNRILRPDCYFKIENNIIKSLEEWSERSLEREYDIEKIYRNGGFDE